MSSLLLAKLKNKPVPKKIEQVQIVIPEPAKKEEVEIKTLILDKRTESNIDRNAILERIRMNKDFKGVTYKPELTKIVQSTVRPESPLSPKKLSPVLEKESEQEEEKTEEPTKKKRDKRVRLIVEEEKEQPPELQIEELLEEKKQLTPEQQEIFTIKVKKRRTKKPKDIVQEGPFENVIIGREALKDRLPPEQNKVLIRASNYYMNNRKIFVNFISSLFSPYREKYIKDKRTFTCDRKTSDEFELLTHQNVVRDYLNLYTPYRGLLLYHGLGSGKT